VIIFFAAEDFKQNPLAHREGSFRAELPAAEAANTAIVVKLQLLADYFYYLWWAPPDADATKNAPAFQLHRPGCKVVSEAILDKAGETELHIGERRQFERGQVKTL